MILLSIIPIFFVFLLVAKKGVLVVRDIQRLTRDPYHLGILYSPMRENEVPVISINEPLVLGTKKVPNPASDLLAPILVSAGFSEVSTRLKQTLQGVAESKAKGISAGSPVDLYPKDVIEPRGEIVRLLKVPNITGNEIARRIGKSTSFFRKQKKKIADILTAGGDELLNDWLETINLVRNMEIERGVGLGKRAGVRMRTVRRMTSGYINNPAAFPKPTQADLNNYFDNFNEFKPKRSK